MTAREAHDVIHLTVVDVDRTLETLGVTSRHPLFVVDRGWVNAGELKPGDNLRAADLSTVEVIAAIADPTPQLVHNMEVAEAHTYAVGELGLWGHNAGWRAPSARKKVWDDCGGICTICKTPMVFKGPKRGPRRDRFTVGHIKPKVSFPELVDDPGNLTGECCSCNCRKRAKYP